LYAFGIVYVEHLSGEVRFFYNRRFVEMKYITLTLVAGLLASTVHAGNSAVSVPADAPSSYRECAGSCHVAFPLQVLSADHWQKIMANLDEHYGDKAVITDKANREITNFVARNADTNGYSSRADSPNRPLPKLTKSSWFAHAHHTITNTLYSSPRVRSSSNCGACHTQAGQGSFLASEVRLPGDSRLVNADEKSKKSPVLSSINPEEPEQPAKKSKSGGA
jgi:hypothetical protein